MNRLVSVISSRRAQVMSITVIAGVGVVWLVARFLGLSKTPPSFWMDEAWDAVHTMCLAQTGHDGAGNAWPLFSPALGGGNLPITWTAFDVGWTRVFGTSRAAFRSASAFWVVVTSAGLFSIARSLVALVRAPAVTAADTILLAADAGVPAPEATQGTDRAATRWARSFPWLVLLAALVSPWSFQFSRISWEGPLAPAFMVLAMAALLRMHASGRFLWAVAGGVAAGLATISYPPLRVTVPLVLVFSGGILLAMARKGAARRALFFRLAAMAAVVAAVITPVIIKTIRGEITTRTMDVAIFAPKWLDEHRGGIGRVPFFFISLLDNIAAHLKPSYLFFTGDVNFRHSSHIVGQLSPVDLLAVFLVLLLLARVAWRVLRQATIAAADAVHVAQAATPIPPIWSSVGPGDLLLAAVAAYAVIGGFFAALPAALTWEGVPHSLRSIGAWPFVALFTGAVLALGWSRYRWMPTVIAVVVLAYSTRYLPLYVQAYKFGDQGVFHTEIMEAIDAGRAENPPRNARESIIPLLSRHGDEVLRYFVMQYDGLSCQEGIEAMRTLHEQHH
jgi:hypothetical protein